MPARRRLRHPATPNEAYEDEKRPRLAYLVPWSLVVLVCSSCVVLELCDLATYRPHFGEGGSARSYQDIRQILDSKDVSAAEKMGAVRERAAGVRLLLESPDSLLSILARNYHRMDKDDPITRLFFDETRSKYLTIASFPDRYLLAMYSGSTEGMNKLYREVVVPALGKHRAPSLDSYYPNITFEHKELGYLDYKREEARFKVQSLLDMGMDEVSDLVHTVEKTLCLFLSAANLLPLAALSLRSRRGIVLILCLWSLRAILVGSEDAAIAEQLSNTHFSRGGLAFFLRKTFFLSQPFRNNLAQIKKPRTYMYLTGLSAHSNAFYAEEGHLEEGGIASWLALELSGTVVYFCLWILLLTGSLDEGVRLWAYGKRRLSGAFVVVRSLEPTRIVSPEVSSQQDLFQSVTSGNVAKMRAILRSGEVDVNSRSSSGNTPLLVACKSGREDAAKVLLEEGGDQLDINFRDSDSQTALTVAATSNSNDIVLALLGRADLVLEDGQGEQAIRNAVERDGYNVALSILDKMEEDTDNIGDLRRLVRSAAEYHRRLPEAGNPRTRREWERRLRQCKEAILQKEAKNVVHEGLPESVRNILDQAKHYFECPICRGPIGRNKRRGNKKSKYDKDEIIISSCSPRDDHFVCAHCRPSRRPCPICRAEGAKHVRRTVMEEHAVFWEAAEGALAEGKAEEVLEGAERLAECKICMEDMSSGEIFSCPGLDQHYFCGQCRPGLIKCPSCEEDFFKSPPVRRRALEKMSKMLAGLRDAIF